MGKSRKVSLTLENAADRIHAWLEKEWPEVAAIKHPGIWLTGSKIWRQVYGMEPETDSDLDIFVMANQTIEGPLTRDILSKAHDGRLGSRPCALHRLLSTELRRMAVPAKAGAKMKTSLGGERIHTERGSVDLWTCRLPSPRDQLMNYPEESHGQARVAYCPANGELIILRNPRAVRPAKPLNITTNWSGAITTSVASSDPATFTYVKAGGGHSCTFPGFWVQPLDLADLVPPAPPPVPQPTVAQQWNERCPSCGKGIYRGLVNVEHEGGECSGQ